MERDVRAGVRRGSAERKLCAIRSARWSRAIAGGDETVSVITLTPIPKETPMQTTFDSASDLSQALQRAAQAHGKHEERTGREDPDWPAWYAEYMVREQAGEELPT
jgi:hypothetical protein